MIVSTLVALISALFFCHGREYKYGHGLWLQTDSSTKVDRVVRSRVSCEAFCSKAKGCSSVNFDPNNHECFLNYDPAKYATHRHKFEEKSCSVYSEAFPTPCDEVNCSGNGTCKETGKMTYECECNEGYHGKECEFVDMCTMNQSICHSPNGTCERLGNGYNCSCKPYFYGNNCEFVDICAMNQSICHSPNGTCERLGNGYKCSCKPSFFGNNCEEQCFFNKTENYKSFYTYQGYMNDYLTDGYKVCSADYLSCCQNWCAKEGPARYLYGGKCYGLKASRTDRRVSVPKNANFPVFLSNGAGATNASTGLTECMKRCWRTEGCIVAEIREHLYQYCLMFTEVVIGNPRTKLGVAMAVMEEWAHNVKPGHNGTETVNKCDPML